LSRLGARVLGIVSLGAIATFVGLVFQLFPNLRPLPPPSVSSAHLQNIGIQQFNVRQSEVPAVAHQTPTSADPILLNTNGLLFSFEAEVRGQYSGIGPLGFLHRWNELPVYWTMFVLDDQVDAHMPVKKPLDPQLLGSKITNAGYSDTWAALVTPSVDTQVASGVFWVPAPHQQGVFRIQLTIMSRKEAGADKLNDDSSPLFRCGFAQVTNRYECAAP
jgi:hypothetical protein